MNSKKLSPETIEKLEWLKGRLRKYPHRYDQGQWCGSQGCLAGFCAPKAKNIDVVIFPYLAEFDESYPNEIVEAAQKWLGISPESAGLLFAANWEGEADKFNRNHGLFGMDGDTDEQAAEKACQRIDLFIQSGGAK